MASELESELRDKKWLADFNARKTHLVLFDRPNNTVAISVKVNGSFLAEKIIFQDVGVNFLFQIGLGLLHYLFW